MQYEQMTLGTGGVLTAVALCTIPSVSGLVRQLCKRQPRGDAVYEDADGKSTPEATAAFSSKLPKTAILFFSVIGLAASLADTLLTAESDRDGLSVDDWLNTAAWILLLCQAVAIAATRKSPVAYMYGLFSFFSASFVAAITISRGIQVIEYLFRNDRLRFAAHITELTAALCLVFTSLMLPRRPDVFYDGERIDRKLTNSALNRFTYSWTNDIIKLSVSKKTLDLADLPRPDHLTRAYDVSTSWKTKGYPVQRLWLSIIRAHAPNLILQWLLATANAVTAFGPQWVVLQLLKLMERKDQGEQFGIEGWVWVLWLGVAIIANTFIELYLFWLSWAELSLPLRAQLSALIFEKSMRRKDMKSASKGPAKEGEGDEAGETGEAGKKDNDKDDDDLESAKKTKQGTVNLIGIDAKRVAEFCSFQYLFPGSIFKLIVSLVFLTNLIGWKALLAGLSTMAVIMPLNFKFSKLYSDAQDVLMKLRDEKLGVVTEALQGIRQIKFSALEPQWEDKIGEVRERELASIWNVFMYDCVLIACWIFSPTALSVVALSTYAWLNGQLTPSVAFVSLGVFRGLETSLSVIPELTTDFLDAWVSVKRIEDYLNGPEVEKTSKDSEVVRFENASIAWPSDDKLEDSERFVLRDINLTFPAGELSVISGKTGTGKSLALSAILGEADVLAGTLYLPKGLPIAERHDSEATPANWVLPKSMAYISQIPWIENTTIRENILFGLPFDEKRYRETIKVCCLTKDLEMLTDGENTEIGANGINLSGGQRWRVTLARAIYSRAGILVMDDIFSAVDAHVGRSIFEDCINGSLCTGRTRILVTHHVALCAPKTKYLVELGEGHILHAGLVEDLIKDGTLEQIKQQEQSEEELREEETADATAVNSEGSEDSGDDSSAAAATDIGTAIKKVASHATQPKPTEEEPAQTLKFVEDEKREEGAVSTHVYSTYLSSSGGWPFWLGVLAIFVAIQGFSLYRSWWLRLWTSLYEAEGSSFNGTLSTQGLHTSWAHSYSYSPGSQQQYGMGQAVQLSGPFRATDALQTSALSPLAQNTSHSLKFYLGIYVVLSLCVASLATLRYFVIYHGSIRASRLLFAKLSFTILRAPLRWLDTVPLGRILNRFTSDFNIIDSQMAYTISAGCNNLFQVFTVITAGFIVSPGIVLLAFCLLSVGLYFGYLYINAARPAKRLESTAKSPVFDQFGTALAGVATIRGFDKAEVYVKRMYRKLDDWSAASWHLFLFNRWVGWRMGLVGAIFSVVVAAIIMGVPGMDSALAGFGLAFALEFSGCIMWTVRCYANMELQMNAAERIVEYTELSTESLEGQSAPAAWPTEGRIEVRNLSVGYAPELPDVLHELNFSVQRNQRVGVVGRTGAGKSSLTLALFRFLEARSGSVYIDGIDISKLKLSDLRSRLAIIPQDPVLFSGTIRSNLDPFDDHSDEELRDCLERVHLSTPRLPESQQASGQATPVSAAPSSASPKNSNIFDDLQSAVSEGGLNLSQGQRQLLCLARAIVRRPRVMVLDEATSAVDMHTDGLIQRSIREEFTDSTLLVIAHRLSTIADFDRILVLKDGTAAEYGAPKELWNKGPEESIFRAMCEESGEYEKLKQVVLSGPSSSS